MTQSNRLRRKGGHESIEAVKFSIGVEQAGYNVFVLGPVGAGRHELVRRHFGQSATDQPLPDDWCYVYNFQGAHRPKALCLPAGRGAVFRDDMKQLVDELRTAISSAFEGEGYQARQQEIAQSFVEKQEATFEDIREKAREQGLALMRTPSGLVIAPVQDGEVMSATEVQALSEERRAALERDVEELQEQLRKALSQMPRLQHEMQSELRKLNREIAEFAVGGLFDEMRQRYSDLDAVIAYVDQVQKDIIEEVPVLLAQTEETQFERDQRNVPIFPTKGAMNDSVEHIAQMGALMTDFNLIKPGTLHRANGGYLILDARKLLMQPFAWGSFSGCYGMHPRSTSAASARATASSTAS